MQRAPARERVEAAAVVNDFYKVLASKFEAGVAKENVAGLPIDVGDFVQEDVAGMQIVMGKRLAQVGQWKVDLVQNLQQVPCLQTANHSVPRSRQPCGKYLKQGDLHLGVHGP
ncbi:hypothetical protein EB001_11520 [bacterium]|nr:hypothetical protein [bacterium]